MYSRGEGKCLSVVCREGTLLLWWGQWEPVRIGPVYVYKCVCACLKINVLHCIIITFGIIIAIVLLLLPIIVVVVI